MNKYKHMRYFVFGLLVSFFLAGQALAGVSPITFTINFNETGNATIIPTTGSSFSESGVVGPGPDGITSALHYLLPIPVGTGPVKILDPDGSISDFLVFGTGLVQNQTSNMLYFLSDPGSDLADLSATNWATAVSLYSGTTFSTTEAADGTFSWGTPYNGTSGPSAVPEPSTILLLGAGLAGVGIVRRRFKK